MVEYRVRELDRTLHALSDPTRRAIFQKVARGGEAIGALADNFPISLNAVSKHIKVLEKAGLVERRQEGRTHFIEARPAPLASIQAWLSDMEVFWSTRLDQLETVLENQGGKDGN